MKGRRRQGGEDEPREPIVLEPTAADRAAWAAAEKKKHVAEGGEITMTFRGKSITMTAEKFEEMAERMRADGTASEDADAPPAFPTVGEMGAVQVSVLVRDRDMLVGALAMAQAEAAAAISARRNLGLSKDEQVEGIHAVAHQLSVAVEKREANADGTLQFELNAHSAPVLRIGLWLWMRWAERTDEKSQKKGLGTMAQRSIKVAQGIADTIVDQLGLL